MKEENAIVNMLYQSHHNIKENLQILNDTVNFVKSEKFWEVQEKIFAFFDTHLIGHFQKEEAILEITKKYNKFTENEDTLIDQILDEHRGLLESYEKLKSLMSENALNVFDKKDRFIDQFRDLIKTLVSHAEKEDRVLFPILLKYMDAKQLHEADEVIKKINRDAK